MLLVPITGSLKINSCSAKREGLMSLHGVLKTQFRIIIAEFDLSVICDIYCIFLDILFVSFKNFH